MNKERLMRRAAGALAVVALVLVTNEGYRHVRAFVDDVAQAKQQIASLKREVYVLQMQLDTRPTGSPVLAVPNAVSEPLSVPPPVAVTTLPIPGPIGPALALPESPARHRAKAQSSSAESDDQKSQVSVVLMSDPKPASTPSVQSAKSPDESKMDVKLVGDAK